MTFVDFFYFCDNLLLKYQFYVGYIRRECNLKFPHSFHISNSWPRNNLSYTLCRQHCDLFHCQISQPHFHWFNRSLP